jgi:hypothetical protein
MIHGKSHRRTDTRQRLTAVAREPARLPLNPVGMLLGLIIVLLVLGKSGVMV